MDCVVMILGVCRIDGHERQVPPIFAAGYVGGSCGLRFGEGRGRKHVRNPMGMDRDQADGALVFERTESLPDPRDRQTVAAFARDIGCDQVTVAGMCGRVGGNAQFPSQLFLVDWNEPPPAAGERAEDAEYAMLGAVDDFDDAAAGSSFGRLLDPQQGAIADARSLARTGLAGRPDQDFWGETVDLFVPF